MSTTAAKFFIYFTAFPALLLLFFNAQAQRKIQANIRIDENASLSNVFIEGEFLRESAVAANNNWSFLTSSAGAENLGERISDLNLSDLDGQKISVKKLIAGEYSASGKAIFWSYKIDLTALQNVNAMAHVSWIKNERGILMPGDLFPQFAADGEPPVSASVKFDLPKDWNVITRERKIGENTFAVEDVEKAIFLVGKNWRAREVLIGKSRLNLALSGDWQFSDDEALKIAAEIYGEYEKMFGESLNENIQISLARFPSDVKFGRWEAETRGANLTVLSSDMPFKTQSLQRLHEQLRHELFHLWIPNRLALTGNYDWFYEGFAVYQSLKTGVAINRISFEDFLDTLAQAYDSNRLQTQKISLIDASKNRWSVANNQIYARGMIVAFLCDAALLRQSGGRRSVSDVLKQIYRKHRLPNESRDGNTAILEILKQHIELNAVVENYIEGTAKIDWKADLESIGIEQTEENSFTHLKVKAKLTGRQKNLLDDLGYNNWRKLSEKQK